jgi:signal transduction histidine kinase
MIVIFSDITKIKELERLSKKMRAMFFSSIAHELRTPLNSIIPMVRMILDNFGH